MSVSPAFNEDDRRILGAFFEEHRPHLNNVLKRFIWDEHHREDFIGDVFVRVLQKWRLYDRQRPFWPWLQRVALNYLNAQVRNRRWQAKLFNVENLDSFIDADAEAWDEPPLEAMIRSEETQQVRELVGAMPEHLRETVALRYWEIKSGPQIADIMNVPIGTVYRRLHEAHQLLKRL